MKKSFHNLYVTVVLTSTFLSLFPCNKDYLSQNTTTSHAMIGVGIPELIVIMFILAFIVAPIVLVVWALIDILKAEFTGSNKVVWILIVLFVPGIGPILYFAIGRKQKIHGLDVPK